MKLKGSEGERAAGDEKSGRQTLESVYYMLLWFRIKKISRSDGPTVQPLAGNPACKCVSMCVYSMEASSVPLVFLGQISVWTRCQSAYSIWNNISSSQLGSRSQNSPSLQEPWRSLSYIVRCDSAQQLCSKDKVSMDGDRMCLCICVYVCVRSRLKGYQRHRDAQVASCYHILSKKRKKSCQCR